MATQWHDFQVREVNGQFRVVWHDDNDRCVREGYNVFANHADAVKDAESLEKSGIRPKHWPAIAND